MCIMPADTCARTLDTPRPRRTPERTLTKFGHQRLERATSQAFHVELHRCESFLEETHGGKLSLQADRNETEKSVWSLMFCALL